MGWYMVKSGLADDVTVSHYRLSAHLLLAFVIISYMFWIFLNTFSKKYKFFYFFDKQTSFVDFFNFNLTNSNFLRCFSIWFRCRKDLPNLAVNELYILPK